MSNFFYANKQDRNAAFHFPNNANLDAEVDGDQGARLHPVPAVLGLTQKVATAGHEPAPTATPAEQNSART